jgi:hypothetical protein
MEAEGRELVASIDVINVSSSPGVTMASAWDSPASRGSLNRSGWAAMKFILQATGIALPYVPPSVVPLGPEPKAAANPAATTFEATSTITPAPRKPPTETAFSAAEIAALLARGDWLFATGDVASARLLYERAADAGVARAAVRLGATFDPVFSGLPHPRGLRGDSGTAVFWYRRARDLGATGVASRLKSLEAK